MTSSATAPEFTLYGYFRSSAAFRVRIALNLKGIAAAQIPVHLLRAGGEQHGASYRSLNPQELVPTLVHDGRAMGQSLAIKLQKGSLPPLGNAPAAGKLFSRVDKSVGERLLGFCLYGPDISFHG